MQATKTKQTGVSKVVAGRVEITGVVKAVKLQVGEFGDTWKILVQDDRGFVVYGTAAKAFRWFNTDGPIINSGDRVRFTATVEASKDDNTFGFFKRPTAATVLAITETTLNALGDVQEAYRRFHRVDGFVENYPWVKGVEVILDPQDQQNERTRQ